MSSSEHEKLLEELEALEEERDRRIVKSSYIPQGHTPHPKQQMFLSLDDKLEVLYGGSVGGGKSEALLMSALKYVNVPGYSALILRRTYQDLSLPGAVMARAHEWLYKTDAHFKAMDRQWVFPSGAHLTFGYLNLDRDKYRYASAEFQYVGFDELTQFPEAWFRFLFSRLRGPGNPNNPLSKVPLRMRAATNPGSIGHEWVRHRFGIPDQIDFNKIYENEGRIFVPSRLEDNPSLSVEEYDKVLQELGPAERDQLRHGKWVRDAASLVYHYYSEDCVIEDPPDDLEHYVLGVDFGFKEDTAFVVIGWRDDDPCAYVVYTYKQEGMSPSDVAEYIIDLGRTFNFQQIIGDSQGLGMGYVEEARKRFGIPIVGAEKHHKRSYIDFLNGAVAQGNLKLVRNATYDLVAEWKTLPWKSEAREKEHEGFANHLSDALLYGWRACYNYLEKSKVPGPEKGTPEHAAAVNAQMKEKRRVDRVTDIRNRMGPWWKKMPSERLK